MEGGLPAAGMRSLPVIIARERAVHFDPEVVEAFLDIPFGVLSETALRYGVILREE